MVQLMTLGLKGPEALNKRQKSKEFRHGRLRIYFPGPIVLCKR